jgi:hypothetical protein
LCCFLSHFDQFCSFFHVFFLSSFSIFLLSHSSFLSCCLFISVYPLSFFFPALLCHVRFFVFPCFSLFIVSLVLSHIFYFCLRLRLLSHCDTV